VGQRDRDHVAVAIDAAQMDSTIAEDDARTKVVDGLLEAGGAWSDRLRLLGDPEKTSVPDERLLSADYTGELAAKVETAIAARKPMAVATKPRLQP
jgi:gamma-glutamyltranspeptidase